MMLVAVTISAIAAWYSVAGLTAIFAAAVIPVIIMGGALEAGKILATVWLHNNWRRVNWAYKSYLIPAIVFLMLLTSMGIFGFLSKAHSDQSLVSGDATSRVAIYDEKIQTAKGNIDANRRALKQMDEAVDQVMGRSQDEKGADKAVAIRRGQQKERVRLLAEISAEQKTISQLSEERAPLAAEVRKVEADVGPVKYIAALIYGDNPDQNVLERAVRWVIILIVVVFDPLALCLILASNKQLEWVREDREKPEEPAPVYVADVGEPPTAEEAAYEPDDGPLTEEQAAQIQALAAEELPTGKVVTTSSLFDEELTCYKCGTVLADAAGIGPFCPNKECDVIDNWDTKQELPVDPHPPGWMYDELKSHPLMEEAEVKEIPEEFDLAKYPYLDKPSSHFVDLKPMVAPIQEPVPDPEIDHTLELAADAIEELNFEVAQLSADKLRLAEQLEQARIQLERSETEKQIEHDRAVNLSTQLLDLLHPPRVVDVKPVADNTVTLKSAPKSSFGTEFPETPSKGDLFLRTDYLPTRLFKFNGNTWIGLEKGNTDSYAYDDSYINYLISKVDSGEYDSEDLSETEREQIANFKERQNGK